MKLLKPMRILYVILSVTLSLQLHARTTTNKKTELASTHSSAKKGSTTRVKTTVTDPVTSLVVGNGQNITDNVEFAAGVVVPVTVLEGTGTVSGIISGEGSSLGKNGAGALVLSGKNTYSGGTVLSAGKLLVKNNAALGTGAITLHGEAPLALDNGINIANPIHLLRQTGIIGLLVDSGTGTLSSVIAGIANPVAKLGAGSLILSGNNTYVGNTWIDEGTLAISNAGSLGTGMLVMDGGGFKSLASLICANSLYCYKTAKIEVPTGTLTLSGSIGGESGIGLVKTGMGTLSLTGDVTYTGSSTINAGILELSGKTTLGTGEGLTINGGSLAIATDAGPKKISTLDGGGNGINLNNNTLEVGSGSFAGTISGTGGTLAKTSDSTLALSGNNTYSGGTTIAAGKLVVGNNAALGTGTVNVYNLATLSVDRGITVTNPIAFAADGVITLEVVSEVGTLTGAITGENSIFSKIGRGTLVLSGESIYSGGTRLAEGELVVGNSAALGTGAVTISERAILSLNENVVVSTPITLADSAASSVNIAQGVGTLSGVISGDGVLGKMGAGTLILSGKNTYTGGTLLHKGKLYISDASNLGTGEISFQGGVLESLQDLVLPITINLLTTGELDVLTGTLTLSGKVMGNELVKTGMGTLALTGDATYTGSSIINAGILELSGATTLGSGKGLIINGGSFVIATGGSRKTIGTLHGKGDGINLNDTELEISSGLFAGDISGVGGALTKTGAGLLTLSGNNTFTGDLSINQGLLQIATEDALSMGVVLLGGGILSPSMSMTINNAISVTAPSQISTASGTNVTIAGIINGNSNLTKSGAGKTFLTGNSAAFTGTITVEDGDLHVQGVLGGTVMISSMGVLGGTGTVGTVQNNGTVIPGASIGTLNIAGDYTQDAAASLTIEIENKSLTSDLLLITGTANLNGSLVVNPMPGIYESGTVFTFLQANAVNGFFKESSATGSIGFDLNYLSDAVQIVISSSEVVLPVPISELNGNAKNVAQYLFSCPVSDLSGDLDPIAQALVDTSAANFPAALRQLGPQKFGSLALSNLQTSVRIGLSMNQTSDVFDNYYLTSGIQAGNQSANQFGTDKTGMFGSDQSIWVNPIGYYYKHNEVEEQIPFNSRTYGFTAGFRTRFFNHLIVSAGTGYTFSNLNWLQNNGGAHIQSVYLSPSIGYIGDYGYAALVIVGSRSFYDVNRKIRFGTFQDEAENKHKSYDLLAGLRGSVKLQCLPNNLYLLPTINIDYLNIFESGYQESAGGAIDLSVKNMHSAFLRPEVTLKLLKEWNTCSMHTAPSIYVGWLRNAPLTKGVYTSRFYKQQACEKDFTAQTYDNATDQLVLGAEVLVMYKANGSLKLGYEANIGNKYSVQEGKLNFSWAF